MSVIAGMHDDAAVRVRVVPRVYSDNSRTLGRLTRSLTGRATNLHRPSSWFSHLERVARPIEARRCGCPRSPSISKEESPGVGSRLRPAVVT
jgi:hypothetical protein